ncbi:hypothetical protein TI39_contig395g00004 [Zymoseptoria brevis]|uniref:Uncharacterized protein n=1 Tax=Zymoseptoria brevis TaxID=1047168 RepID=A0A0F4GR91_9PEZI|nr:hypothetical protein TI39_contig395g00004 [Zymoseptoria brevis]
MALPSQRAGSKPQHPLSRSTLPNADSPPAIPGKDGYRSKALPLPPPPPPTMQHLPVPMQEGIQEQARSAQNELFPAFVHCSYGGASREDQIERIDEEVRKSSWVLNGDLNRTGRHTSLPTTRDVKRGEPLGNDAAKEKKTRRKWFQVWRPKK